MSLKGAIVNYFPLFDGVKQVRTFTLNDPFFKITYMKCICVCVRAILHYGLYI